MTQSISHQPVVVGIDGSDDALRALDWASSRAARHGLPIRLVHVTQTPIVTLPAVATSVPPPVDDRLDVHTAALDQVARSHPELRVTAAHLRGHVPSALLAESENANLLVVGREGLGRSAELLLGSVSLACAGRACVPVGIVPASWTPPPTEHRRVVVGVDGTENCQAAVEFAFNEASEQDAELVAVFACAQAARWPEGWPLAADNAIDERDLRRVAARSVDTWREKYPNVAVTVVGEPTQPAEALRRHAGRADLAIIGGRSHRRVTGTLLGSVARAILRAVEVPLIVVPQPKDV